MTAAADGQGAARVSCAGEIEREQRGVREEHDAMGASFTAKQGRGGPAGREAEEIDTAASGSDATVCNRE